MQPAQAISRIILDPGHVGGDYFDLRLLSDEGGIFREGDFTFAWASALKEALETRGIEVQLTHERGKPSTIISKDRIEARAVTLTKEIGMETALQKFRVPRNFFRGMSEDELLSAAVQNEADLIERARLAGASGASLCLSLHLNGDPNALRSSVNGICAFSSERFLSETPLFHKILRAVCRATSLPIYSYSNLIDREAGLFIDETLTLMKNATVPTLLLEGPFQNNTQELPALKRDMLAYYERRTVQGRLQELVDGVVEGLCGIK